MLIKQDSNCELFVNVFILFCRSRTEILRKIRFRCGRGSMLKLCLIPMCLLTRDTTPRVAVQNTSTGVVLGAITSLLNKVVRGLEDWDTLPIHYPKPGCCCCTAGACRSKHLLLHSYLMPNMIILLFLMSFLVFLMANY